MKDPDYIIAQGQAGRTEEFEWTVQKWIDLGYEPCGGLTTNNGLLLQAMWKKPKTRWMGGPR